jgi:hypothetical protein
VDTTLRLDDSCAHDSSSVGRWAGRLLELRGPAHATAAIRSSPRRGDVDGRGVEAERVPAGSNLDRGDIWVPDKTFPAIQVKNHARLDLSGWVDDVAIQARNAGRDTGIVIHKRRGKGNPASWYVTCTLDTLITLIEGKNR